MKAYRIGVGVTRYGYVNVLADSPEDAKQKAKEIDINDDNLFEYDNNAPDGGIGVCTFGEPRELDENEYELSNYFECPDCGYFEQLPADQQRHHMAAACLELGETNDKYALYECPDCLTRSWSKVYVDLKEEN